MDVIAAYRDVGTYRAAAAICGTTHKTVRRIIEAHEAAGTGSDQLVALATDAVQVTGLAATDSHPAHVVANTGAGTLDVVDVANGAVRDRVEVGPGPPVTGQRSCVSPWCMRWWRRAARSSGTSAGRARNAIPRSRSTSCAQYAWR